MDNFWCYQLGDNGGIFNQLNITDHCPIFTMLKPNNKQVWFTVKSFKDHSIKKHMKVL